MQVKTLNKYKNKTLPQLLKLAQKHFNAFIRKRDTKDGNYFVCISCATPLPAATMHAGHYLSAGHHTALRFNEDNCFGQCVRCNYFLSGNQVNYRRHLVEKIGLERVEELEAVGSRPSKHDRYTLIDIIETYKAKCKATP